MKKYKVIANGVEYEVLIELLSDDAAPAAQPAPAAEPEKPAAAAGDGAIKAPLTGSITTINVKAGDTVKKGQVLMILEAMKMENEIMAAADGKITSVNVNKGDSVETGAVLCTIG
jgi:biotin carboxyl carrier protein